MGSRRARRAVRGRRDGFDIDVVELPPGVSVSDAVAAYRKNPEVVLAEPNYVRYPAAPDPFFSDLWGLQNTGQQHKVIAAAHRHFDNE